jgi:hypothetical protein
MVTAILFVAVAGSSTACGKDASTPPIPPFQVTFTNSLGVPITVSGSGAQTTRIVSTGAVVFPGGSLSATITPDDLTYSDGSPIPDDLGPTSVPIASAATITITNVFGTQTYFRPYLTNSLTTPIVVGIAHAGQVRCLGTQAASVNNSPWGFYELEPTVEFRYYRDKSNCTGPYRYWDAAAIQGAFFIAGSVFLTASVAP